MILKQFLDTIEKYSLFQPEDKILIAVSGGKDSMALLNLAFEAGFNIDAAHFNFKLRGKESDKDQEFVEHYCAKRNIPLHVKSADTKKYAKNNGISTQMAARELRYDWFKELILEHKINYIATAHQADDNLETLLLNITKGTGPKGLTGIPVKTHQIVRPLLEITANQVKDYLLKNNLKWREDASNQENFYARNKIRNEVLPILQNINPGVLNTSQTNIKRFRELNRIFEERYLTFIQQFVDEENILKIPHQLIASTTGSFLFLEEYLKKFNFSFSDIENIFTIHQSGKKIISQTHSLIYDRDYWTLYKNETITESEIVVSQPGKYHFANHSFEIELLNTLPPNLKAPNTAVLNSELIKWPLKIRLWSKGDRFTPFGMKGSKLISDYLKDIKLDSFSKNNQTVIVDQNEILWLTGLRINDRYKVEKNCKHFLQIKFESK